MAGHRIARLNGDIQKELSDIIRGLKDPRVKGFISVIRVDVSGDLSYADVFISAVEGFDKSKEAVEGLKHGSGFIKRELASRLTLRKTPDLRFIADNSIEYSANISKKIREINHPEEKS
jgi:ribosome-binding factor A